MSFLNKKRHYFLFVRAIIPAISRSINGIIPKNPNGKESTEAKIKRTPEAILSAINEPIIPNIAGINTKRKG